MEYVSLYNFVQLISCVQLKYEQFETHGLLPRSIPTSVRCAVSVLNVNGEPLTIIVNK